MQCGSVECRGVESCRGAEIQRKMWRWKNAAIEMYDATKEEKCRRGWVYIGSVLK